MAEFRVFLSAVSSEFESARDALGASLRSRGMLVRVQSDFRKEVAADTTLRKLHDYIRDCSAVVCIIGERSGGFPSVAAAAPFAHMLPPGNTEASYTQWEFWFARHYKRRLSIYIATDKWDVKVPPSKGDRPDLQEALIHYIVDEQDLDRGYFGDVHHLCHLVLQEDWPQQLSSKPIVLPYQSLGDLFKGREAFISRLLESLNRRSGGAAAIAGRAVHGMGGVGKTRAAVEYAWAHLDDYIALALLDSETPEKLNTSFAALTVPLGLPARNEPEQAMQIEAVLAWLNGNRGWLLILDNVDTEAALAAATRLLGRLQGGHVIVTSRLAQFGRAIEKLDLDVLSMDDAASFLLEATAIGRRKTADDTAQARTLAEELGWLAIALEMAAATIEKSGLGFAAYRALWQNNRPRVVGWDNPEITDYHRAVTKTWQTSVDQLTDAGRRLLERLAYLAPDPVPEFLLDIEVPGAERDDARAALDDLVAYSLVVRDVDGGTFLVHRLVQDATRRGLEASGNSKSRLTESLNWINAWFADNPESFRDWNRLESLVPHVEAVTRSADKSGIAEPTGQLMVDLGRLFQRKSLYAQSEPLMRRALGIAEIHLSKGHPIIASRLNALGILLRGTNRLREAQPLLQRALAIYVAVYGENHPSVAMCLDSFARLLQDMNRLAEAEPLYCRALAIAEKSYGENHPDVATYLNGLAGLLQDTNRSADAAPLYRRALAIYEEIYSADHPNVATVLNNLASALEAAGPAPEAEAMYRRALAIHEANFGSDHPNVAALLNNLAQALIVTQRFADAEPLLRRALAINETIYGREHPIVAICLNNLASLLQNTNRLSEAEPLMRRHLAIFLNFERATGYAHPHRDAAIANYASLLAKMGKTEPEIESTIAALRREAGLDPG
jgi:tetratricopeptide (TPR) repeat protein